MSWGTDEWMWRGEPVGVEVEEVEWCDGSAQEEDVVMVLEEREG